MSILLFKLMCGHTIRTIYKLFTNTLKTLGVHLDMALFSGGMSAELLE